MVFLCMVISLTVLVPMVFSIKWEDGGNLGTSLFSIMYLYLLLGFTRFHRHAESLMKLNHPTVEYIPLRDYFHRHTRSLYWEGDLIVPSNVERLVLPLVLSLSFFSGKFAPVQIRFGMAYATPCQLSEIDANAIHEGSLFP
jgi:hypothetical protein